jgi:iron complex outermembrane receptor protein
VNQSTKKRGHAAPNRSALRLSATAMGAMLLMTGSGQVLAQAAEQTVEVTGIRRGIEAAISVKKNADSIVEAISAEDIGKLPDATVAETISRIPGLTTQRSKATGKAQSVGIRGLAPDFATGTLNGREQASTSDSRSVDFDQFPAELVGGVEVYKSPIASQINQGLAGTINLKTVRPLDFGKRQVAVNFRKQQTGKGLPTEAGSGDRTSLSYIDQFADRKIGIALGFTRVNDDGAGQLKFNSWGGWAPLYDTAANNTKACNKPDGAPANWTPALTCAALPGGFTADTEQTTTKRDGAMAVLQYKPNKDFESTLDVFYTKGDWKTSKKGLEGALLDNSNYDPTGTLSKSTVAGGIITAGTMSDYKGVVRNHDEATTDKLTSIGWNNKLKLGGWATAADLSQSKVTKHSSRYETTAGQPGNANKAPYAGTLGSISWTGFDGKNFENVKYSTSLNYADPNVAKLTDVNGWSGGENSPQAGYVALPTTTDKINALRLSGKRDMAMGPITDVELGVNFTERTKTHSANEGRLVILGSVNMTTGATINPYAGTVAPGAGTAVAGTTGIPIMSWNPTGSVGTIYDLPPKVDKDILNKSWDVKEKVTTAYVVAGMETKLFGRDARGNLGLQIINTDQTGAGYFLDQAKCTGNTPATCPSTRIEAGTKYTDILPSMNVTLDMGNDSLVRMGLGRALSRPAMADMRGSMSFDLVRANQNITTDHYEGSGGNPNLKPFRANTLDLSFEKYFGNKGYVSVAGFYKDLATYVYKQTTSRDFSQYGVTLPPSPSPVGFYTSPANGSGGSVKGIELAVSVPFGMFAKPLDGFGVQFNHSYTESSVAIPFAGLNIIDAPGSINLPLPGLSRNSENVRVYYEKYGFQVSVAKRTRSDFLGEVSDFQDNRQLTFVKGESTVDVQLSYEFQSGPAKGLSLIFQGNNLTKTAFQRFRPDTGAVVENIPTGKTYQFGLNYKL